MGSPLESTLVEYPLSGLPVYDAISYRWGKDSKSTALLCDDAQIPITPEVAGMLQQLRSTQCTQRLWIDAICIDQQMKTERTDQVKLMHHVYRQAAETTIWLGEEDHATTGAFALINELDVIIERAWTSSGHERWPAFEEMQRSGLPSQEDVRWSNLQMLLLHPWFTRTWVLQEACLSTSLWVQKGSFRISWQKLLRIILTLYYSSTSDYFQIRLNTSFNLSRFCLLGRDGTDLLSLLSLTTGMASSDEKDKIFALVGLASDHEFVHWLVDYDKPTIEVYTDLAVYYLLQGDIAVLNMASDPGWRNWHQLPTWVPDWSIWPRAWPMLGNMQQHDGAHFALDRRPKATVKPRIDRKSGMLTVRGVIVDHVKWVGRNLPYPLHISDRDVALLYLQQWQHLANRQSTYPTGEDVDQAFARTITLDRMPESGCSYSAVFQQYVQQFESRTFAMKPQEDGAYSNTYNFHDGVRYTCIKRTFFVTGNGFFGVGPYHLRPGDQVAILDGGLIPFTIRKAARKDFSLVGDAYIHGIAGRSEGLRFEDIRLV
ncbi:hypothetical protein LTR37_018836 [Vermiconidia calcicola]|uniref:Uncharacterized protein n=1 Tax=Vermiconidia calcicola TaxID=1690605 RepID=A0ACC3MGY5_9PEZI|nr:hypothetical protein LTR37_018836 [Vermiconidia calcicola]